MGNDLKPAPTIDWYRSPLAPELFKSLHERSDWRAFVQTGGFLAIVAGSGTLTYWSWANWAWPWTLLCIFAHGTVSHFHINGMHELGHGTAFKTRALNAFFVRVVSFFSWSHPDMFNASHLRHHRYTLHPPDDQEVVLPVKLKFAQFIESAIVNPRGLWLNLKYTLRLARGRIGSEGGWEQICFPENQPKLRRAPIRWARFLLGTHVLIAAVSIYFGQWIIPLVVSCGPFIGGWLFFLLNNSQHIGRHDNVPDFRLCCRTILPNPVFRFLYWQMNYHTEHHMYAAVPCYNLKRLHEAIRHELPPCYGIIGAWREITGILRKQAADPNYKPEIPLPPRIP